ncbi:hypothetical protein, partial [Endozoicomonas sp. ONNA2]|uniref:hypothetical protein n=1 Tax=Endozoicomonas sp. ONNA2 TaxID=2828741 RepID=UPI0021473ABC
MKAEMLSFFKGFEDTRVELTNAVHSGFSLSPELRTLIDTLQSSGKNLVKLMNQVNKEAANLLAESNYYRVGRLAFKANLLTESYRFDSVINELKTEIDGACKNTFSELIERYSNLQNLPSGMNANVPLNEVVNFSFTYDPIQIARLANSVGEGFCRADSLLSAISGQEGNLLKSLDSPGRQNRSNDHPDNRIFS